MTCFIKILLIQRFFYADKNIWCYLLEIKKLLFASSTIEAELVTLAYASEKANLFK